VKPTKRDDDAIVDLLDVLLDEGVVVEADVLITVADVPLVGVKLRAAVAGMTTMTEYGMLEQWDEAHREANGPEPPDTAAGPSEIPVSADDRTADEP
jgi:hypothetical protein